MKRYNIRILSVLMGLVLLASCTDENIVERKKEVPEGLPATVKLDFATGSLETVETKAAIDGDIYDMYVIVFNENGNSVITKKYFTQSDLASGSITFETTTGDRLIYALANVKGINDNNNAIFTVRGGSVFDALESVNNVDELRSLSISLSDAQKAVEFAEDRYLMSGVYGAENDDQSTSIVTISENGTISSTSNDVYKIWFTRLFSKVDFKINAGTGITFIPTSWDVVNVPVQSYLYVANSDLDGSYFPVRDNISFRDNAFSFLMQENRKKPQESCSNEDDREAGSGKDKDRTFSKANSTSTYVILRGNYSDKDYNGQVIYYIHLGNATSSNNDWNNFDTKRNKNYKYTLTIAGVNRIVKEVSEFDPYERADGDLTDLGTGKVYEFDAPYAFQVLSFDRTDLSSRDNIVFQVKTPYTNNAFVKVTEASSGSPDYSENWKWVHFLVNEKKGGKYTTDANRFPGFDGSGNAKTTRDGRKLMDIVEFFNFLKDPDTENLLVDGEIYVTCFIDEYKYKNRPWTDYVNSDNRLLQLFCNVKEGNGSSITSAKYVLSQQSICSFYSTNNSQIGAWGIQRELSKTALAYDGKTKKIPNSFESMSTGHANMVKELDLNSLRSWYSDTRDGLEGTISYSNDFYKAYAACMQKNRDENGDGVIDQDEIKWYLPAINQYTDIWLGTAALPTPVYLYPYSDGTSYFLYSSTTNGSGYKQMLWAQQGSSFGDTKYKFTNGDNTELNYRCIRNFSDQIDNYYTYTDKNERGFHQITLNQMDSRALRSTPVSGALDTHNQNSQINRPYKKFIVASNNALVRERQTTSYSSYGWDTSDKNFTNVKKPGEGWTEYKRWKKTDQGALGGRTDFYIEWQRYHNGTSSIKTILDYISDKTDPYNPCTAYSENGVTGWRFPNQRELALMIQIKDLVDVPTMSYTGYEYNWGKEWYAYNGLMHLALGDNTEYVRCVKDVE